MGNDFWHVVGPNYPFNKWKYHWCRVLNPAVDAESNKSSLTAFWLPEMQRQREFSAPVLWRTCCDTPGTKSLPLPGFKEKKKKKSATKANSAEQDACNCCLWRAKIWEPPYSERRQNASSQTHERRTKIITHLLCRARRRQTEGAARLCLLFANETNIVLKETLDTLCIRKFVLYGKGWGEEGGGKKKQGNNITISLVQCMHNRLLFSLCIW